jgi:hypothetical protein
VLRRLGAGVHVSDGASRMRGSGARPRCEVACACVVVVVVLTDARVPPRPTDKDYKALPAEGVLFMTYTSLCAVSLFERVRPALFIASSTQAWPLVH